LRNAAKGQIGIGRHDTTDQVEATLKNYFNGTCDRFDIPLTLHGSAFTQSVWTATWAHHRQPEPSHGPTGPIKSR
jgi:AraC family transcriptional regulator of adaptative response/methylated-DNA-[protein]-cysteine methyltransferase